MPGVRKSCNVLGFRLRFFEIDLLIAVSAARADADSPISYEGFFTIAEVMFARHGSSSQLMLAGSNVLGSIISLTSNLIAGGALI